MALTLISLLIVATNVALAAPVVQRDVACQSTYISAYGDTCRSIGLPWGYYDTDILAANTFLDCNDIWVGTPICIPDIPRPVTVTYPGSPTASTSSGIITFTTPAPLPTPVCSQTYISSPGDNCDNIGANFGITGTDVYNANTFLNCADIWAYTPICIPAIFYPPTSTTSVAPACASTYWSVARDTCQSIGSNLGYSESQIKGANSFLNCDDIWANTPICLPSTTATPTITVVPVPSCIASYTSVDRDTCDIIGAKHGITGNDIHNANTFLNCSDIWTNTPICIPAVVIIDPFPTDEPLTITFNPTDPVTSDPPTATDTTSDPVTEPATQTITVD